jgi:hypothetical protein
VEFNFGGTGVREQRFNFPGDSVSRQKNPLETHWLVRGGTILQRRGQEVQHSILRIVGCIVGSASRANLAKSCKSFSPLEFVGIKSLAHFSAGLP